MEDRWCDREPRARVNEATEMSDIVGGYDRAGLDGECGNDDIDIQIKRMAGGAAVAAGLSPDACGGLIHARTRSQHRHAGVEFVEQFERGSQTFEHEIATHFIVDNGRHNDGRLE